MLIQKLRSVIRQIIFEAQVSASPEYMKKEAVMQQIQKELAAQVRSGKIVTKKQMDSWLDFYMFFLPHGVDQEAAKLSINTLKSIPDPSVFKLPGAVASEKISVKTRKK
jgi:hypothetical protein